MKLLVGYLSPKPTTVECNEFVLELKDGSRLWFRQSKSEKGKIYITTDHTQNMDMHQTSYTEGEINTYD